MAEWETVENRAGDFGTWIISSVPSSSSNNDLRGVDYYSWFVCVYDGHGAIEGQIVGSTNARNHGCLCRGQTGTPQIGI